MRGFCFCLASAARDCDQGVGVGGKNETEKLPQCLLGIFMAWVVLSTQKQFLAYWLTRIMTEGGTRKKGY